MSRLIYKQTNITIINVYYIYEYKPHSQLLEGELREVSGTASQLPVWVWASSVTRYQSRVLILVISIVMMIIFRTLNRGGAG